MFPQYCSMSKRTHPEVRKAILDEAEQGRYAAVAVGRTGAGQGLLEKIFMGSVSDTLFRELERAALWVCH